MVTRKRKPVDFEPEPVEDEPVAATDVHKTSIPGTSLATGELAEYQMPDGSTYLLSADEAKKRGAKSVARPANKAVTPQNK
jgi:hypothetical protein